MNDELLARCRSFVDEQSCDEWDDKAINEDAAKLYEFVQREAASALRLAAQSPEPVAWRWRFEDQSAWTVSKKRPLYADDRDVICEPLYTATPQSVPVTVKPLEWNEYTDERGGPDWWDAETLAGTYYGIALLVDGFFVEYDYTAVAKGLHDLDAAKAAAQADYEQRIRSALVNVPMSASDDALREALERLKQGIRDIAQACVDGRVCDDVAWFTEIPAETLFDKCCNLLGEDLPTRQSPLAASEATKSDGGVESRYAAACAQPRGVEPEVAPGPSDLMQKFEKFKAATDERLAGRTRHADVTVEVRAKIDWWLREIRDCNERMWNGSREMYFGQIDKGVDAIRALLDTYKIGAK